MFVNIPLWTSHETSPCDKYNKNILFHFSLQPYSIPLQVSISQMKETEAWRGPRTCPHFKWNAIWV